MSCGSPFAQCRASCARTPGRPVARALTRLDSERIAPRRAIRASAQTDFVNGLITNILWMAQILGLYDSPVYGNAHAEWRLRSLG